MTVNGYKLTLKEVASGVAILVVIIGVSGAWFRMEGKFERGVQSIQNIEYRLERYFDKYDEILKAMSNKFDDASRDRSNMKSEISALKAQADLHSRFK